MTNIKLGECNKNVTELADRELQRRLTDIAGYVWDKLEEIEEELLQERALYPGALYKEGDFVIDIKNVLTNSRETIENLFMELKNE
jgi:hypothetical protein